MRQKTAYTHRRQETNKKCVFVIHSYIVADFVDKIYWIALDEAREWE